MPAWPGGNCPDCGEYMPEKLIHCQRCRALLNSDLDKDSVEIPSFVPLPEIEAMVDVEIAGYQVECPKCNRELRINRKYVGEKVSCKHCQGAFKLDLDDPAIHRVAFYANCPHCGNELRAHMKYANVKVECKHCSGHLSCVEQPA